VLPVSWTTIRLFLHVLGALSGVTALRALFLGVLLAG
jgi:hypothetical protein